MEIVNVKGIVVELGGRKLTVPPLNFKALQQLQGRLEGFSATSSSVGTADMALVADVLESALRRNYDPSDVSRDFIEEHLDVGNMMDLMQAAMDVGGLLRKKIESELAGGGPSTGTSSTAS